MSIPPRASDRGVRAGSANRVTTLPFCRTIRAKRDASGGTDDRSVLLRERRRESDRERCCSGVAEGEVAKAVGAIENATTAASRGFAEVAHSGFVLLEGFRSSQICSFLAGVAV